MHAFLLIAHGSRREASNNEVRELAVEISKEAEDKFDLMECCFLELANPSIPAAIRDLAEKGVKKITVFPYFLAVGAHVAEDIPDAINEAKVYYPEIDFLILPHLGKMKSMPRLIIEQITD